MMEDEKIENEETSEEKEEVKEEKVQKIDVKVDTSEISKLKEDVSNLKELIVSSFKEMKEKKNEVKVAEEKVEKKEVEEKVDRTKGIVNEEKAEVSESNSNTYVVEKAKTGNGFSLYMNYSKNPKLKRLNK